ncbi:MAG: hypothetical protein ACRD4X_02950 [Candidatus Acidiferrales bacterium]
MRIGKASKTVGIAVLMAGLGVVASATRAQSSAPAPPIHPGPGDNVVFFRTGPGAMGAGDAMDFIGFEAGLGGKTVTGTPFTATISAQETQTLADGNQINRTTTGTIARDSQGRVRREMTLPAIGAFATTSQGAPHVIFIEDVVAGTQYILDPDRKIAHQVRMDRRGRRFRVQNNVAPPPSDQGNVTTASLGTQTINGVQAQGTRYTRTIPAGQIGNEKPIVITTERWYSPDLQMYVLTKTTDPVRGNSVRQLTNIQMGEPDPSLFQVPPDYTVKKGRVARIRRRMRHGAGAPPPTLGNGPETAPAPPN